MAQWFWRRGFFFNFINVFSLFRDYLPLEKGGDLHLYKLESPIAAALIVPSLVEIGPVVLEKKMFKFRQCIFIIS